MTIELYVFPPSPRAFKVMAVANHLGLDTTLRFVDLRKGEHKTPEYAALNPNMRMPTLKHDDVVLWAANAITQYLASLRPEGGLLPKDEKARLDVTRWQFWDLAHWDSTGAIFAFEICGKAGDPRHRRARHDGHRQGHRVVSSQRKGARRPAQAPAVRHRGHAHGCRLFPRRRYESRRAGAFPDRAV